VLRVEHSGAGFDRFVGIGRLSSQLSSDGLPMRCGILGAFPNLRISAIQSAPNASSSRSKDSRRYIEASITLQTGVACSV
jgi:hypothetical protein